MEHCSDRQSRRHQHQLDVRWRLPAVLDRLLCECHSDTNTGHDPQRTVVSDEGREERGRAVGLLRCDRRGDGDVAMLTATSDDVFYTYSEYAYDADSHTVGSNSESSTCIALLNRTTESHFRIAPPNLIASLLCKPSAGVVCSECERPRPLQRRMHQNVTAQPRDKRTGKNYRRA